MKQKTLQFLSLLAAVSGPRHGYCTANAGAAPAAPDQADASQARIAELERRVAELSAPQPAESAPVDSTLSLLAKGAGLKDLTDVTWRIQAGLSAKQAVDAAVAQIAANSDVAKAKKGGK